MTSIIPFQQLASLCSSAGIEHVIISPGSRNAALTIAFTSNKALKCYSISDERSAAYIAMGMALMTGKPSVIICTSGTAALNYAPAIAEAFFQEIPLVVLTADRPPEWIHQYDGQTIFQDNVYGKHVKKSYIWPADQDNKSITLAKEMAIDALQECLNYPFGPIHINIPIYEPFYPDMVNDDFGKWEYPVTNKTKEKSFDIADYRDLFREYEKKLLVIGQQHDSKTTELAFQFAKKFGFTLIADSISNVNGGIKNQDSFIRSLTSKQIEDLKPQLLISTDMSLISKSLKLLLRNWNVHKHIHIQDNPLLIDPFRSITEKLEILPSLFFEKLLNDQGSIEKSDSTYKGIWEEIDLKAREKLILFFKNEVYAELNILYKLIRLLPHRSVIHVGNSMSVRYLNLIQTFIPENCIVYANRGTSGIDGILSTAVGQALCTSKDVFCILGDVSFQYDKNALWNRYLPDNLKIVIINNAGGIIFSMIDGPKKQDSFNDYFRTSQPNKADLLAQEYGLDYLAIYDQQQVDDVLSKFFKSTQKTILEIFTDYESNEKYYKSIFQ